MYATNSNNANLKILDDKIKKKRTSTCRLYGASVETKFCENDQQGNPD